MNSHNFRNSLLQQFDPEVISRLRLEAVDLPAGQAIESPGKQIDHLFFLEEGMASMTATFPGNVQVQIALAGYEAVLGASALMGFRRSLNRVYMQIGGSGFSSPIAAALREFKRGRAFHDRTLLYFQARFVLSSQTAACNALHSVEQRLARWLLLSAERNPGRVLPLSHEYIAEMIGSSRQTVSTIASRFQEQNLISYARGQIHLIDLSGLEQLACECYRVVRDHLSNDAASDQGLSNT